MLVTCIAIVILGFFAATGASLQPPESKTLGRRIPLLKPKPLTDSLHNFKVLLRKLELHPQFFGNYVGDHSDVRVEMYNDTMPVVSGKFVLLKDAPSSMKIRIVVHTMLPSNQWKLSFDQGWLPFCRFTEINVFFRQYMNASNFTGCPVKKGTFTFTNIMIDERGFPPSLPERKFRITVTFSVDGQEMGGVSIYAEIILKDIYDD